MLITKDLQGLENKEIWKENEIFISSLSDNGLTFSMFHSSIANAYIVEIMFYGHNLVVYFIYLT